ncbi:MAG: 2Fe-2S iron-sulfur cluster-binding protein [Chitinophagaceae bacterium]
MQKIFCNNEGFCRKITNLVKTESLCFDTFAAQTTTMYTIKINFEQKGLTPVTLANVAPDQSLLEVCLNNGIELHHNCGAVCACSTCHIYVNKGMDFLEELSDKEEDFIDRAISPRINSRLGCQCVLQDDDGEVEITLPDQTQFLGE